MPARARAVLSVSADSEPASHLRDLAARSASQQVARRERRVNVRVLVGRRRMDTVVHWCACAPLLKCAATKLTLAVRPPPTRRTRARLPLLPPDCAGPRRALSRQLRLPSPRSSPLSPTSRDGDRDEYTCVRDGGDGQGAAACARRGADHLLGGDGGGGDDGRSLRGRCWLARLRLRSRLRRLRRRSLGRHRRRLCGHLLCRHRRRRSRSRHRGELLLRRRRR
mmetsp:Transcript_31973/g.74598  ORF Transcript_31973/g.74598 Transcript_31973/m.74598 type:complete len:223 (+) Transcript_31973:153-821(+)